MILNNKQEQGLKIAVKRYKDKEKYTVISGYAGTGKTTLVRFIIDALNIGPALVCYASFTGKAAEVLRKKGNPNAMTLHKLLYDASRLPDGSFSFSPKKKIPYKIIVVDECSMVPKKMIDLISSYDVYALYLGDPFQISPIEDNQTNNLLDSPHIFLSEIMRQEKDSEIIKISMDIREMKPLQLFKGQQVQVIKKSDLSIGMLNWADQILCATNNTRHQINKEVRNSLGFPADKAVVGDKLISLRNLWDLVDNKNNPLINGTICHLNQVQEDYFYLPYFYEGGKQIQFYRSLLSTDEGTTFDPIDIDKKMLLTEKKCVNSKTEYLVLKNKKCHRKIPQEFAFGYAITTHKAQGSSWDKVLVIEENFPWDKITHARHLYTSLTRAVDKCIIVKKG